MGSLQVYSKKVAENHLIYNELFQLFPLFSSDDRGQNYKQDQNKNHGTGEDKTRPLCITEHHQVPQTV